MKRLCAFLVIFAMLTVSVPVFADTTEKEAALLGDAVFVRPVGAAAVVAGVGLFIISLPFALVTGSVHETGQNFVGKPFKYTFQRPMGDFEYTVPESGAPANE